MPSRRTARLHLLVLNGPIVLSLCLTACKSAEERCNEARVAAHDAWAAYVPLIEADERAAAEAFENADPNARRARDEACSRAWLEFVEAATGDDTSPRPYGSNAFVVAALAMAKLGSHEPPCALEVQQETTYASGADYPRDIYQRRIAAIERSLQTYEQQIGAIRDRSESARRQLIAARDALAKSTGPAIPARDAARATVVDDAHPEYRVAADASNASWDACSAVNP